MDYRMIKKLEDAVRSAEKSGDAGRMVTKYDELAQKLRQSDRYDEAIAYHQRELKLCEQYRNQFTDYDRVWVRRYLGINSFLKKDYDKCIKDFKTGLRIIEKSRLPLPEMKVEMARYYENLGASFEDRSQTELLQVQPQSSEAQPKLTKPDCSSESQEIEPNESQDRDSNESQDRDVNESQDRDVNPTDYESLDDELFVFEHVDDLTASEDYFRRLLEFHQKYIRGSDIEDDAEQKLEFHEGDKFVDECFCILKLVQAKLRRYRSAVPYNNDIDLSELVELYDRALEVCHELEREEILYRKACTLRYLGGAYRADAVELFNDLINRDNYSTYFKRKSYEKVISFTLQIGCFSNCIALIRKSLDVFPQEIVNDRLARIKEIERIFNADPSDGLPMICCEQNEFRAANDLYSELLRNEADSRTRIDLWMDKEALLERWHSSICSVGASEAYDRGRKLLSVVSEARFSYLNCIKELESDPNCSKRYHDVLREYAKFLSHHNCIDEAIKVYNQICESSNASSGMKAAASSAIERLLRQSRMLNTPTPDSSNETVPIATPAISQQPQEPQTGSQQVQQPRNQVSSISPDAEVIELSDSESAFSREDSSDQEQPINRNRTAPKKGQAILRKSKVSRRVISDSDDTEDIVSSDAEISQNGNHHPAPIDENEFNFTEADATKIASYSQEELYAKLKEEKAGLKRPIYLAYYNLEIATRLEELISTDDNSRLKYYEQAAAFIPPGAERRFIDLKNLFFNKGRVHRRLGQFDCAIRDLKRASELFNSKQEMLERADCLNELGHLYLVEAEKLESSGNEYTMAFRHCLGRISLGYFEQAQRLLKANRNIHENKRVTSLSIVLSNKASSWLIQGEKRKAATAIAEAIGHCRQFGGLENWLCQSLNTSHDINKSLRRFEDAKENLRDCLKYSKLKGGEKVLSFDFYGSSIDEAGGDCFGSFYWNSKLSLAKLAIQMHKIKDARHFIAELVDKCSSFQKDFRAMVKQTNRHLSSVAEKLKRRDELLPLVEDPHAEKVLDLLRELCTICEYIEDFENLIIAAKKWKELAIDQSDECSALDALYYGYKELQYLKEAADTLRSLCAIQKRININATTRFWNLYQLALLLLSIEDRDSADLDGIVGEMEVLLKEIESATNESSMESLQFKAAVLDIRYISCHEGDSQHCDEEICTLFTDWRQHSVDTSSESESSEDRSDEEQSCHSEDVALQHRRKRRRSSPTESRSGNHVRRRLSQRPGKRFKAVDSGRKRSRGYTSLPATGSDGNSLRASRNSDGMRSQRRTSNGSEKSDQPSGVKLRRLSSEQNARTNDPGANSHNAIDSIIYNDGYADHLQGMLSEDEEFCEFGGDVVGCDPGFHVSLPCSSQAPPVNDSVSARVWVENCQFLVICNASNDVQWLIDEVASRFYRDQARRPVIKHLLVDGAIVDGSDLVMPLIRPLSNPKLVAVVSHFQEIALSISYQSMCQNHDEYSLNFDIVDRISAVPLQTIDISYVVSLPGSISPLIKLLPGQKHNHLTELVFDCSGFDDTCARLLAEVISDLQHLQKLSIACTFVTTSGATTLLQKPTSLRAFDTHAVDLSQLQADVIQNFFQSNSKIQMADFSFCQLKRFPLLHSGSSIQVLRISGNNFSDPSEITALRSVIPVIEDA